jgi:hypothetical protein
VIYFSIQTFDTNGLKSDFANQVVYTNKPESTNLTATAALLPSPPIPGQDGSSFTNSPTSKSKSSTNSIQTRITNQQSYVLGIPPSLTIDLTNQHTHLMIWGTQGAEITLLRSTNLSGAFWQTVTNLTFSNTAALPASAVYSQRIHGVLSNAFLPSFAELYLDDPDQSAVAFHRAVMQETYPVLADKILTGKGYATRLIMVRMPGVNFHDACFIGSEKGFIDCRDNEGLVRFQVSDATIRKIATTVADSLQLHWTSASEFICSNGMRVVTATVSETDSPASDPVPGSAAPQILIDF